ncbi:MAG TPA: hypothetical protein VIK21_03020, partial [Desulfuromonadaceae bacterium]
MLKVISHFFVGAFLFIAFMVCSSQRVNATEEYAKQTGQLCAACHLDPAGGGELTATGKTFAATLHSKTESPKTSILFKGLRLV